MHSRANCITSRLSKTAQKARLQSVYVSPTAKSKADLRIRIRHTSVQLSVIMIALALFWQIPSMAWAATAVGTLPLSPSANSADTAVKPDDVVKPDTTVKPEAAPLAPITRSIDYDPANGLPQFKPVIEDGDKNQYRLVMVGQPRPKPGVEQQRYFQLIAKRDISIATYQSGDAKIREIFSSSQAIEEKGFRGAIALQSVDTEPVFVSQQEQVEKTLVYSHLASEDVLQLPASAEFTVTSDAAPNATTQAVLQRLGVSWQVTAFFANGRPQEYAATVTFRGKQSKLVLDHYRAIATYGSNVLAVKQIMTVDASYLPIVSAVVPATLPADTEADSSELSAEAELPNMPVMAVNSVPTLPNPSAPIETAAAVKPAINVPRLATMVTVAIVALALLPLLYFMLRPDARLVQAGADGSLQKLLSRRLRLHDGIAVFKLPDSFRLANIDNTCQLFLDGRRYQHADYLELQHRGRLLWREVPKARIAIGLKLNGVLAEQVVSAVGEDFGVESQAA